MARLKEYSQGEKEVCGIIEEKPSKLLSEI
jgi:hypothetical protein